MKNTPPGSVYLGSVRIAFEEERPGRVVAAAWIKRGRLFEPAGQAAWIGTHAALPIVDWRVEAPLYISVTRRHGRSHIGSAILPRPHAGSAEFGRARARRRAAGRVRRRRRHDGVPRAASRSMVSLLHGLEPGRERAVLSPAGLAVSEDGVTFRRWSHAPLLDRRRADPYLNGVAVGDARGRRVADVVRGRHRMGGRRRCASAPVSHPVRRVA